MDDYDTLRQAYKPDSIKVLMIAESPPPTNNIESSRHFYRTDRARKDDRLFVNTVRAVFPETLETLEDELESRKESWLKRLQSRGFYMIEALENSLPHEITKQERQALIRQELPGLVRRVSKLVNKQTRVILIKSNVFIVAAQPLRDAGFTVLNTELLDYPGHFNQRSYRQKLSSLLKV